MLSLRGQQTIVVAVVVSMGASPSVTVSPMVTAVATARMFSLAF